MQMAYCSEQNDAQLSDDEVEGLDPRVQVISLIFLL